MYRKSGYGIIRNTNYALAGLWDMLRHETSFKLELCVSVLLWLALPLFPIPLAGKLILGLSLFIPMIAEAMNSAIERTVDLVTQEFHEQAKRAKDVGSAIVFLSILLTTTIWLVTLRYYCMVI